MANRFTKTRTFGMRSCNYELEDHLAASNPHPQYFPTAALTETVLSGILPYIEVAGVTVLYHDPINDASEYHAASMKAANVDYNLLTTHTQAYSQTVAYTDHRDSTGEELYAHRLHTHTYAELDGVASSTHTHSEYATNQDYVLHSELAEVGIYPTSVQLDESDYVDTPLDFNNFFIQGNFALPAGVLNNAANKPDVDGTITGMSFLKSQFATDDLNSFARVDDDGNDTYLYHEASCIQTLFTSVDCYMRVGFRPETTVLQSANVDPLSLWQFGDWYSSKLSSQTFINDTTAAVTEIVHRFDTSDWVLNGTSGLYECEINSTAHTYLQVYQYTGNGTDVVAVNEVEVGLTLSRTETLNWNNTFTLRTNTPFAGYLVGLTNFVQGQTRYDQPTQTH